MHNPGWHYGIEEACEAGPVSMWGRCAYKVRGGKRCGRPAVGLRELPLQYRRELRLQAVCELHQRAVDHRPPPLPHPDAPAEPVATVIDVRELVEDDEPGTAGPTSG
jgi:hypothetical protein